MTRETSAPHRIGRSTDEVADTVRAILSKYVDCPAQDIPLSARLEHDLQLDSFAIIEMTVALENAFRVPMTDATDPDHLQLVTVDDLIKYVRGRMTRELGEA